MKKYALVVYGYNETFDFVDLKIANFFSTKEEVDNYMELVIENFNKQEWKQIEGYADYTFVNPLNELETYLINVQEINL
jgi:hypothetical protein